MEYSYKITNRPETRADITGGTDYEMRYKGLRWNIGGIYKFSAKNSLQANFTVDRFRYGKEYDVETKTYAVGDYVQSKKQRSMEGELKAILGLMQGSTTIFVRRYPSACLYPCCLCPARAPVLARCDGNGGTAFYPS